MQICYIMRDGRTRQAVSCTQAGRCAPVVGGKLQHLEKALDAVRCTKQGASDDVDVGNKCNSPSGILQGHASLFKPE